VKRRTFITLLGGAAAPSLLWPLAARAQQPRMPVIGVLNSQAPDSTHDGYLAAFRQGLKQAGYVEGQNVAVEYRWANNQEERVRELAADLVRRQVAVIFVAGGAPTELAAKAATSTIPVVFMAGADPVQLGLVASLNRPGGNVTGVTFLAGELGPKRIQILRELAPEARTFAFLADARFPNVEETADDATAAARALGRQLIVLKVASAPEFDAAFATLVQRQAGALCIGPYPIFSTNRDRLVALAARHKIPTIYFTRDFATDGGLISYGASVVDAYRLCGVYVGQILKGAKPADLPVQTPTRYETVLNLKTAKALGLAIPPSVLAIADEVIE
jgi:putative ABC transport system substrate-binding protein